jgi:hypothetical protein
MVQAASLLARSSILAARPLASAILRHVNRSGCELLHSMVGLAGPSGPLAQLIEQRLGFHECRRIETFREPAECR